MSNSPFLSNCTADTIHEAAAALKAGHLVAFPTETVYGLGADARNPDAVKRIYEVKGRPSDHPLIVHISSLNQLEKWTSEIPDYAIALARNYWPGPMTLIFKRSEIAEDFITGGQDTVGLRVPSHPLALSLISEFEKISNSAIAAPSANRFGQISPTCASDVVADIGNFLIPTDIILDGGRSNIGIESTIIDCTNNVPRILRNGSITHEDVLRINCGLQSQTTVTEVKFSGSFERHYAPKCKVIVGGEIIEGAGFLALKSIPTPLGMIRLGYPENEDEFARILYSIFRLADSMHLKSLVVAEPIGPGIARAIRERLSKASYQIESCLD
jgi:L-threonylcarbamoyladenylate synthase